MYDSMEPVAKKRFLEDIKRKYSTMDAKKKKELLSQRNEKLVKAKSVKLCINKFKRKMREGPYFICTICNRILYSKSVITCINEKYPCQTYFSIQQSFDGKQCICNTCHSKVIKGKLPCQAVMNNMYVCEIPTELSSLEKLEKIRITQRIVFEKIGVMHKGHRASSLLRESSASVLLHLGQCQGDRPFLRDKIRTKISAGVRFVYIKLQ